MDRGFKFLPLTQVLILALVLSGCKEDPVEEATLPANLEMSVAVSDDTPGLVEVSASADNVNYFTIEFEEDGVTTTEESNDGTASYTYSSSGDYTIVTKAHSTASEFVEDAETVSIDLMDEDDPSGSEFPSSGYETPTSYSGYDLVWSDEFDGTQLSDDWNYEIGAGGWGNNELQYYRQENTSVFDGVLKIEAKAENFGGASYTSSRLTTEGNRFFTYGRVDIRAALPYGKGIWPALWMLGENFRTIGWPRCGEIDIMEMVGGNVTGGGNDVVHGTIHWDNDGTKADYGGSTSLSSGIFADEFHVFSIIWDDQSIKWLLDDNQYHVVDITPADLEEFHEDFFFIFNIAVGGNWPGSPNSSTEFPQAMYVDYIRVFQEQ